MKPGECAGILHETLPNGLRVIVEPLREFSSVSIGIWALAGSRDEVPEQSGITHFIEHLAFKGTAERDARRIALEIDSLGGSLNAFTGKEFTSFYARVLGESLSQALDVLSDITLNSLFEPYDINRERDVILQEISMVDDTPDDCIHDLHCREFWSNHSLGLPILGTHGALEVMERDDIVTYHGNHFVGDRMIITAAGALDPEAFLEEVSSVFSGLKRSDSSFPRSLPEETPGLFVQERPVEQVHFCVGYPGLKVGDDRRYVMSLLNTIQGGGMSSRLFQRIREEFGLAYSIYSYPSAYQDAGMQTIYCGTSKEGFPKALQIIREETRNIIADPVPADELETAKLQLKGNLLLGLESTGNRMNQLARNEIYFGRQISIEEIQEGIDSVTSREICDLSSELFREDRMALTVIGPVSEEEVREIRG
jgi:predicted Zn-dependent peptidase